MKKAWIDFINSFKPTYAVVVNLYHVIPNFPEVQKFSDRQDFGKGEYVKAKMYYDRVVRKNLEVNVMPADITLIKGKKTVMETRNFGPVDTVKSLRISA